eukprot:CAMPEP_0174752668 /NCGR_PEP_ID=MMETSP1094-20130205/102536_1 /TAXON_ID=156173 /ORGANISM="Chrysochromulina brevifilum, Strain UTEX LB 985" /LENGTH=153 /DNA_ID=CAMNT_0015958341 /DNA_START=27 /DNA_END=484 /DNA_ORIENTATION=-
MNIVLSWLYRCTWIGLLLWCIAIIIAFGGLLALFGWVTGCTGTKPASDVIILAIAHVISFGEEGSLNADADDKACILVTASFSFLSLLLQAALFAVTVTRFLNPQVNLLLSSRLCVSMVNGKRFLTFRMAHPLGFTLSHVQVEAAWGEPCRTA